MSIVLLTGGTGFIGKALVKELLREGHHLLLFVRDQERAKNSLQALTDSQLNRVQFLQGDLVKAGLGLNEKDTGLALTAEVLIHAGGPMNIELDEMTAKRTFLNGTREIADLAKRIHDNKGLQHFIHFVGYMSPFVDSLSDNLFTTE
jgi:nucleoside-diphosphate-sugar epimerase